MKGYLKVEAIKNEQGHEGLQLSCELEHVGAMDRFHILRVVCDAIHMDSSDLKMFCMMKEIGIFDSLTERHTKCDEAIPEQGGEETSEDGDGDGGPNIIIGAMSGSDMVDMLKSILNPGRGGARNEG